MKITICIPVYRAEAFVERCARSLLGQTYQDLEIIFVNDASPDGSQKVLERVIAEFPGRRGQVLCLENDKNLGAMSSRLRALSMAQGEWIGFCDADDWMDPDALGCMIGKGDALDADVVMCDVVRNESELLPGSVTQSIAFDGTGLDFLAGVRSILAYPLLNNKLFRKSLLERTRPVVPSELRIGEDLCFVTQAVAGARRIVSVEGVSYHYRWNPASVTGRVLPERVVRDAMRAYETLVPRLPRKAARPVLQGLICNILLLGLKHSVLTAREYRQWRAELRRLGCGFEHQDATRLRRLLMRIADVSYGLASHLNELFSKREVSRI